MIITLFSSFHCGRMRCNFTNICLVSRLTIIIYHVWINIFWIMTFSSYLRRYLLDIFPSLWRRGVIYFNRKIHSPCRLIWLPSDRGFLFRFMLTKIMKLVQMTGIFLQLYNKNESTSLLLEFDVLEILISESTQLYLLWPLTYLVKLLGTFLQLYHYF